MTATHGAVVQDALHAPEGERLLRVVDGVTTAYRPGGLEVSRDAETGEVAGQRHHTHAGHTIALREGGNPRSGGPADGVVDEVGEPVHAAQVGAFGHEAGEALGLAVAERGTAGELAVVGVDTGGGVGVQFHDPSLGSPCRNGVDSWLRGDVFAT